MPENPDRMLKRRKLSEIVGQPLDLEINDEIPAEFLAEVACHLYFEVLRAFPALIRQWWRNQNRKLAGNVERFTAQYMSNILIEEELKGVIEASAKKMQNFKVHVRNAAAEVVATYTMDELAMELVIKIPPNFPLGTIEVDSGKKINVTKELWRKWMLQMVVFLMHENGSLMSGILQWKRNIDKHLEGVDDCAICMQAIHHTNHQLPKISCKQCKKKFHSACLFKWFETSNNTTCPLCRTVF